MTKKILEIIGYVVICACFGLLIYTFFLKEEATAPTATQASKTALPPDIFAMSFPDADGKPQALKQWQGKVIVLNFWATWCPPCREEMPELSELYKKYQSKNVVVLGVATDDVPTIKEFSAETKVSYPLLAADMAGSDLAASLGNNQDVLPYTVIIKADGTLAKTFFGRLSMPKVEEILKQLI